MKNFYSYLAETKEKTQAQANYPSVTEHVPKDTTVWGDLAKVVSGTVNTQNSSVWDPTKEELEATLKANNFEIKVTHKTGVVVSIEKLRKVVEKLNTNKSFNPKNVTSKELNDTFKSIT